MKYLFGTFVLILFVACSSDLESIEDYNHAESNSSIHEFEIADDAKLIIHADDMDFDKATLDRIKEAYTMAHLGIAPNDEIRNERIEKGKYKWEEALFLQVPKKHGSYYWKNVDIGKVDYQTYQIKSKLIVEGNNSSITLYDLIYHRVTRKTGVYDFKLYDYVADDAPVVGIRARLYGHRTDIYLDTELLQSEIRCIDNPYCSGSFIDGIDYEIEYKMIE